MINLNKNSITAKLYCWFYNVKSLPTNLCPYFWKVVIMYLLLPFLGIPALIGHKLDDNTNAFIKALLGIVAIIFVMLLISLIVSPIVVFNWWLLDIKPNSLYMNTTEVGLMCWTGLLFVGLWHLGEQLYKYIFNRETHTPKETNVVIAFVKAKYHKYCPTINWN